MGILTIVTGLLQTKDDWKSLEDNDIFFFFFFSFHFILEHIWLVMLCLLLSPLSQVILVSTRTEKLIPSGRG